MNKNFYLGLFTSFLEFEDCEWAQIVRVVAVGDAVDRVVGPVQGAGLDGRLESGKDFQV